MSDEARCYVVAWGALPTGAAKGMFAAQLTLHQVPRRIADEFVIMLAQQTGREVRLGVFHGPCHCHTDAITGAVVCGKAFAPPPATPH